MTKEGNNRVSFTLLLIPLLLFSGAVSPASEDDTAGLSFLYSYRYQAPSREVMKPFFEPGRLMRGMLLSYIHFYSLGRVPFSSNAWDALKNLPPETSLLDRFLLLCDRLVRSRAFDVNLYRVNIRSARAIDPFLENTDR